MQKKFFTALIFAVVLVSGAWAEPHLRISHISLTDLNDGKPDFSDARFSAVYLIVLDKEVTATEAHQNAEGTLTITDGSYSYWDGKEMRNITNGGGDFKLKPFNDIEVGSNNAAYYVATDDGKAQYFFFDADGGLNNAHASWKFPSVPSLNGDETISPILTTQEQLASSVPYIEYIRSGSQVTGLSWRFVHSEDTSTPAPQDEDLYFIVHGVYAKNGRIIHADSEYTKITANSIPEGTLNFDEPVDADDIRDILIGSYRDKDVRYQWDFYNFSEPAPKLWTNHVSYSRLVNGKSSYYTAKFLDIAIEPYDPDRFAEPQYMTNEGTITISGGGYTLKDESSNESLGHVAEGQSLTLQLMPSHNYDASNVEYYPVSGDGRIIRFGGAAETSMNGRTITWSFPESLDMGSSAVIPNYKSLKQQLEEGVPYVELITDGENVTGIRYRIVKANDTSAAITPSYRTDFYIDTYNISENIYTPIYSSGWLEDTAGGEFMFYEPVRQNELSSVVAQLLTYEDSDNPCAYQWEFRALSGSDIPEGDIVPVTPEELGTETLNNIVSAVDGLNSASELHYLTNDEIAGMSYLTDSMEQEMQNDNYEIAGSFSMFKANETGFYVMKVVMTDELYNSLHGEDINNLKIYLLNNTAAQNNSGLPDTWEILTLTGGDPDKIDTKEFLLAGQLNSGQMLSMFIAKKNASAGSGPGDGGGGCVSGLGLAGALMAGIFFVGKSFVRKRL